MNADDFSGIGRLETPSEFDTNRNGKKKKKQRFKNKNNDLPISIDEIAIKVNEEDQIHNRIFICSDFQDSSKSVKSKGLSQEE